MRLKNEKTINKSIFKIYSDHLNISYEEPKWSNIRKSSSTSSGFCVLINNHKKIITNAHCVENGINIRIKKIGLSNIHKLKIEKLSYCCDLAILDIDDKFYKEKYESIYKKFWDDVVPLEIGDLPSKMEKIYVCGFPLGGENLSITSGLVNRIEIIKYFDIADGLAIQIEAPVNSGNSGGPAINSNGKIIGVAVQKEIEEGVHNMSYIIPTVILRFFLFKMDNSDLLTDLGITYQEINSQSMKDYFETEDGVITWLIDPLSNANEVLKYRDIILSINKIIISNDGMILLKDAIKHLEPENKNFELISSGEVISFTSFISLISKDETAHLEIIRNHKKMNVKVKLGYKNFLVAISQTQMEPTYLIILGFVFMPLTLMLYKEKLDNGEPMGTLIRNFYEFKTNETKEVIILSQIFNNEYTDGYDYMDNRILKSVNGTELNNLSELWNYIKKINITKTPYLVFEFERSLILIIKSENLKNQSKIISEQFGNIPHAKFYSYKNNHIKEILEEYLQID